MSRNMVEARSEGFEQFAAALKQGAKHLALSASRRRRSAGNADGAHWRDPRLLWPRFVTGE